MSGHWSKGHWTNAHWDASNFRGPNDGAETGFISGSASFAITASGALTDDQSQGVGAGLWAGLVTLVERKPRATQQPQPQPIPLRLASVAVTDADDVVSAAGTVAVTGRAAIADAPDVLRSAGVVGIHASARLRDSDDVAVSAGRLGPVPITDDEVLTYLMAA